MRNVYFGPNVIDVSEYDVDDLRELLEEANIAVDNLEMWIEADQEEMF